MELPDDWFWYLQFDESNHSDLIHVPAVGRMDGRYWMSEKGYIANEEEIKRLFYEQALSGVGKFWTNVLRGPKYHVNHIENWKDAIIPSREDPVPTKEDTDEIINVQVRRFFEGVREGKRRAEARIDKKMAKMNVITDYWKRKRQELADFPSP